MKPGAVIHSEEAPAWYVGRNLAAVQWPEDGELRCNPFVRMIMHQLKGPGDFFKRGEKQIRQSVLRAGFEVTRDDIYHDEIVLDDPEAMVRLISSISRCPDVRACAMILFRSCL